MTLLLLLLPLHLTTLINAQTPPNSDNNIEYQNHYEVLQVEQTASTTDVKKAYRKLAVQWHPDKHTSVEDKEEATKIFHAIGRAYEVLSDDTKRKLFDDDLYLGNTGPDRFRDPRDHGNIWEQMRRDRLRRQKAKENSMMGQMDNALTYIIPLFLAFGAFRAYQNSQPSTSPASSSSSNTTNNNNNNNTNNNNNNTNNNNNNNSETDSQQSSNSTNTPPSSKHALAAVQLAPSLVQLSSSHFNVSGFLVIVAISGNSVDDELPWKKWNDIAVAR